MWFRKNPIEFEAVQFTGENFEEIQAFVGMRLTSLGETEIHIFNPINTYLPQHLYDGRPNPPEAELWVEANKSWLPIYNGEWVVKDELGFYPCKNEIIQKNNTPLDENASDPECTCQPEELPTFGQEIVQLLNKHSMEKYSGTPDWILGNFLEMVLRQFDCAVMMRANWRGESTDLPALQQLFDTNDHAVLGEPRLLVAPGALDGNDGKTVPLVAYDSHGRRNEIGEATISITPGEMMVMGTITGVIPNFEHLISPDQFSIADTDPLAKGDR